MAWHAAGGLASGAMNSKPRAAEAFIKLDWKLYYRENSICVPFYS
jgi:hypothetical protein